MSATDDFSLQAFMTALAQLDHPLDPTTQQALNQIVPSLEQNMPHAVRRLRRIAKQHLPLKIKYEAIREQLQVSYQVQERKKLAPFVDYQPIDSVETHKTQYFPDIFQLSNTSKQIFSASDSVSVAKHLQRLIQVYDYAVEVFENSKIAWEWLHQPNRAIGNLVPFCLLDNDAGAEQIKTILGRIEYGVYS